MVGKPGGEALSLPIQGQQQLLEYAAGFAKCAAGRNNFTYRGEITSGKPIFFIFGHL